MKKLILTMCLTAAGVFGAAAQMRLTLGEALDLALSENPTVKVAEMEVQRFDYVKRQTWGSWIPQISVGGTYTRSIVKQSMTKGLSFGADNTVTVAANLNVPLFVPSVYASLKLNDAQIAEAVESARSSRVNMVNEVRKAYYNMLLLQESLDVLRETMGAMPAASVGEDDGVSPIDLDLGYVLPGAVTSFAERAQACDPSDPLNMTDTAGSGLSK